MPYGISRSILTENDLSCLDSADNNLTEKIVQFYFE